MATMWIQRADFSSSEEKEEVSSAQAARAFTQHDWVGEAELERKLASKGQDLCPPGIGFVAEDGGILHVCPHERGTMIHLHYSDVRKWLGIIPISRDKVLSVEKDFSREEVSSLIEQFVSGARSEVLARLEDAS